MSDLKELRQAAKDLYNSASTKTKALLATGVASGTALAGSMAVFTDGVMGATNVMADNVIAGTSLFASASGDLTQSALSAVFATAAVYAVQKSSNAAQLSLRADITEQKVKAHYNF